MKIVATVLVVLLTLAIAGCPAKDPQPVPNPGPVNPGNEQVKITAQPESTTLNPGDDARLSIAVSPGDASIKWQKDGEALADGDRIAGSKTKSLIIHNVGQSDEGAFQAQVAKSGGSGGWLLSEPAYVTVNDPVTIITQPVSKTANSGTSVIFTVAADGEHPLYYQWSKNGTNISGATTDSYTIASVAKSDEGSYVCEVSNVVGPVQSNAATLTVNVTGTYTLTLIGQGSGSIVAEPTGPVYVAGTKVTLTAGAGVGWHFSRFEGDANSTSNPLDIIMNSNMTITGVFEEDTLLPEFTVQPTNMTVNEGQPVGLAATAINGTISYQWRRDGVDLPGETQDQLLISISATEDAEDTYSCVASNAAGSTESRTAVVYIAGAPVLRLEYLPDNPTIIFANFDANSKGLNDFLVTAVPADVDYAYLSDPLRNAQILVSFRYWNPNGYEDMAKENEGIALNPNSISNTMLFEGTDCLDGNNQSRGAFILDFDGNGSHLPGGLFEYGAYRLFFELRWLDINSQWVYRTLNNANIRVSLNGSEVGKDGDDYLLRLNHATVATLPLITKQPVSQSITDGQNANFAVGVAYKQPVLYQWLLNGLELLNATNKTVNINGAHVANAGQYSCRVSCAAGDVVSSEATLTVDGQSDNGLKFSQSPTDWNGNPGDTITFSAVVQYIGAGTLEYQWFKNGQPLSDDARISGSNTANLIIADANHDDEQAYYQCGVRIPGLVIPLKANIVKN